ncbi:mCG22364, partial [Mus musculus]
RSPAACQTPAVKQPGCLKFQMQDRRHADRIMGVNYDYLACCALHADKHRKGSPFFWVITMPGRGSQGSVSELPDWGPCSKQEWS